ncbi:hypothetical protein NUU61_000733 [Penicillium alfredii]|uniref:Major facilitator superfamily (MFS) profile domain-containing protein n=1 Tax=Penicillium alfredii TaxID=1506179 RepID=A0A9W9KQ05_9EURO|nr:uncharacterized protein NUU61_000733 [Penicillium alfredii]KAJ5114974.1 hypothetical protein NUU61_000733 [Penicillium alfredii]
MQSYLQYRRLGQAVHRQLDHVGPRDVSASVTGSPAQDRQIADVVGAAQTDQTSNVPESNPSPLAQSKTQHSEKTALGYSLAGIDVQRQIEPGDSTSHLFIVGWEDETDPLNPQNFSFARRLVATLLVSALGFIVGAASSIPSGVMSQNIEAFGVSEVVGSLVIGLYLLGFATGSLVSGPLSEIVGRNAVYAGSLTLFMIFVMASGLAPNIGAQLAFRFLAGIFGCPALTCAGGTIADLWNPLEKTIMFPLYAILSFGGPVLGPVIASYMGQTGVLSWRWSEWIILIGSGAILALIILFQPETYSPLLLKWKGKHFRKATGDPRFRSEMDTAKVPLVNRIAGALKRQFLITVHEPIILLISLYMTVLYIVLFTFFDGYAYIFTDTYGIAQGLTNIIWVAMYIGIALAGLLVPFIYRGTKKAFTQAVQMDQDSSPDVTNPGLWIRRTSSQKSGSDFPSISIWSPILASTLFGLGTICVFISSYMYVIDSYDIYAASALGFMTVSRYCAAGGMTVVGVPFYKNMGVHWTLTILGCISALLVPVPYVFYRFGSVIRRWSRYAVAEDSKV